MRAKWRVDQMRQGRSAEESTPRNSAHGVPGVYRFLAQTQNKGQLQTRTVPMQATKSLNFHWLSITLLCLQETRLSNTPSTFKCHPTSLTSAHGGLGCQATASGCTTQSGISMKRIAPTFCVRTLRAIFSQSRTATLCRGFSYRTQRTPLHRTACLDAAVEIIWNVQGGSHVLHAYRICLPGQHSDFIQDFA